MKPQLSDKKIEQIVRAQLAEARKVKIGIIKTDEGKLSVKEAIRDDIGTLWALTSDGRVWMGMSGGSWAESAYSWKEILEENGLD